MVLCSRNSDELCRIGDFMITIAVCDDNIRFADFLTDKIKSICAFKMPEWCQCRVAAAMNSAGAVLEYMKENTVNILFLDIDMPGENGFQLAEKINSLYSDMLIVFVSAYEDLVFQSFAYSPFRFLRKSVLSEELEDVLMKAVERHRMNAETVVIRTDCETVELRVKDILYIKSEKNYYMVCGTGFAYKCRGTMSQVGNLIQDFNFYKITSGCFVNMERIECFERPDKLVLENTTLYISQRRVSRFKETYSRFMRKRIL